MLEDYLGDKQEQEQLKQEWFAFEFDATNFDVSVTGNNESGEENTEVGKADGRGRNKRDAIGDKAEAKEEVCDIPMMDDVELKLRGLLLKLISSCGMIKKPSFRSDKARFFFRIHVSNPDLMSTPTDLSWCIVEQSRSSHLTSSRHLMPIFQMETPFALSVTAHIQ